MFCVLECVGGGEERGRGQRRNIYCQPNEPRRGTFVIWPGPFPLTSSRLPVPSGPDNVRPQQHQTADEGHPWWGVGGLCAPLEGHLGRGGGEEMDKF